MAPFYSGDRRIPHAEDDTVSYADVNGISLYYEEHGAVIPFLGADSLEPPAPMAP